jgi:SPP1 gp7 family putative phage head morphogenesis protein
MRSPVNRRDPSGTKRIEREEIARQREIISRYTEAMAKVAVGDDPERMRILDRLTDSLKEDLSASAEDWMRNATQTTIRVSDRVLNNLHTGIVLGDAVNIPPEEIDMLKANIMENVRSVGDDLLKDVTRITSEGYQKGWGAEQTARQINKAGEGQVKHAETIVRTETMRVCDVVAKARYIQAGCDGYLSFPTDDDRLCPKCVELATGGSGTTLKVYGLNEPMALPWHPNCRCCRIPHFADQEAITI